MISFVNDYNHNALPEILEMMYLTNHEGNSAYSNDQHTINAHNLIKQKIKRNDVDIQILMGGTQTNLVALAAFLRPHEAVIAVKTGHICVHETGAIESTGHKCIEVAGKDGKVTPSDIEDVCCPHNWDHAGILTVKPRMVYISQSTEVGTVYTLAELKELRGICNKYGLLLYCDGARLSSALCCSDLDLHSMACMCDAFYIGGTKNGALFGEALVIVNDCLKNDFRYIVKQRGGMLAKGWLLGIQFEVLMKGDTYERIGIHANKMASRLRTGLKKMGIKFSIETTSNQLFPIFRNTILEKLKSNYLWETINIVNDDETEIRLVTSWATKVEEIDCFLRSLRDVVSNENI